MALVCALTGVTPEEPVFTKTGYVFDKRALETYLKANSNQCPITKVELSPDDIHPILTNKSVKPRPASAASIPGLLTLMQSEWDSLMLETYTLRSHLDAVRKQLSHSLYQHDAACRVIARLMREGDQQKRRISELQQMVAQVQSGQRGAAGGVSSTNVELGLSDELMAEVSQMAKVLLTARKKRAIEGLATVERVRTYDEAASYSLHSSTQPGVTCCVTDRNGIIQGDASGNSTPSIIVTGGVDGGIAIFDFAAKKMLVKLAGHLKRVNKVAIHPKDDILLSCSDDKTARVWHSSDKERFQYRPAHVFRQFHKSVVDVSMHPLTSYFATACADRSWAFHDLYSGATLRTFKELEAAYACLQIHPDGMIVAGGGSDGVIYVGDLKGAQGQIPLKGHEGAVTSICFSENGYFMASSAADNTVKLWDLRKSKTFHSISLGDVPGVPTNAELLGASYATFDHSGSYLAVCGGYKHESAISGILSVYGFEKRTSLVNLVNLDGHEGLVTCASFGKNAEFLISGSMDRSVKIWEPSDPKSSDVSLE